VSSSLSLEEKSEALMQSCQTVTSLNEEMRDQNGYLRKQLEQFMKQKQKAMESPTTSNPEDVSEDAESEYSEQVEGEAEQPKRTP